MDRSVVVMLGMVPVPTGELRPGFSTGGAAPRAAAAVGRRVRTVAGRRPGSGGEPAGFVSPGGRVVRVTPLGVVTDSSPSGVMTNRQPGAWVLSRWWRRHRQQRFAQLVGPPAPCGTTWSRPAQAASVRQPG